VYVSGVNKVYCQEPQLQYYNDPPGKQEINLFGIYSKKEITSVGVISPDKSIMAYSVVYFFPNAYQYTSKVFIVKNQPQIKITDKISKSILDVGFDSLDRETFRTLTIVDWSGDSKKLLIKEKVGGYSKGIWTTNLWIYNVDTGKTQKLGNIKKAVVYYWKSKQKVSLPDLRWDIIPLGWDLSNPDMIIVNTYGYSHSEKQFLGCWGIDITTGNSELLSFVNETVPVAKNGFIFKPAK